MKTVNCDTKIQIANRKSRIKNQAGFTLVELLVVIAVIAVLMSLLLPALSAAKAKAKAVVCLGHLKGVGTAAMMYVADHDDRFPPYRSDNMQPPPGRPGSHTDPYGVVYTLIHRYALLTCWYSPGYNNDPPRDGDGYLGPYVGTSKGGLVNIMSCPAMLPGSREVIFTLGGRPSPRYEYKEKSYCLNLWMIDPYDPNGTKASAIKRPAELVYMCDGPARDLWTIGGDQYYSDWEDYTAIVPTPRHRNRSVFNMNFYDGHADGGTMAEFYNERHFENAREH